MLARCDLSKLRLLSAIKAKNFRCFSASHAPAAGGGGGAVEHVKVTPRFYEVLGDKVWTDKKMPVAEDFTPTPRTTVEYNGITYPYPYRGIIEEENGAEVLKMLEREGYVTSDGYLKYWSLPADKRVKWTQIWFQRETDRSLHHMLEWDNAIVRTYYFLLVICMLLAIYHTYGLITPPSQNVFLYKNWEKWNAEKKH